MLPRHIAQLKLAPTLILLSFSIFLLYVAHSAKSNPFTALRGGDRSQTQDSDHCLKVKGSNNTFYSQFGQDAYIFHNNLLPSNNGFYIELGAYHPTKYSNTAFLDHCRHGWKGLCIDMNPFNAGGFAKERTCEFINTCVSANKSYVDYYLQDDELADGKEGTSRTPCQPFSAIIHRHRVKHIDFLSIDIEGGEMGALTTFPFDHIQPRVILIETWRTGKEPIFDYLMDRGYTHAAELGPDDLFVWSGVKPWLPQRTAEWRAAIRAQKAELGAS